MKSKIASPSPAKLFFGLLLIATPVLAATRPSLFRGVVVADSAVGVRVVSVEESSQAYQADLRPEDIILKANDQELHSIDDFATLSQRLKGRADRVTLLVIRNGMPREITMSLYSYPILRQWGIEFLPDHDLRFGEAKTGLAYWRRLGRGFEEAKKPTQALEAYLNGLHNMPTDVETALKAAALFCEVSRQHFAERALADGVAALQRASVMMEKLFDHPLTDEQLATIRGQLASTLRTLKSRR